MSSPLISVLASGAAAGSPPTSLSFFVPIVLMLVVMYFLMFRPQMQQQKAHKAKIEGIKKNDKVVTGGGIVAKVISVEGEYCTLEIAPGIKVKALRSTITDVNLPEGGAPAND